VNIWQDIGCDFMERLLIDALGTGLGIFTTLTLFEMMWIRKKIKLYRFIGITLLIAGFSLVSTIFFQNTVFLPVFLVVTAFLLSLNFISSITYKLLLSLAVVAITFVTEMLIGFLLVQVFSIPLEHVQNNMPLYLFGMLVSKLLVLIIVLMFRVFLKSNRDDAEMQFNILMVFMPIQSIILSYIVFDYSVKTNTQINSPLGIVAIFFSISLIFITMLFIEKQRKALVYKKEFELGQTRLKMQIEHYQEIYQEQNKVKMMRHDMSNNLLSISGLLNSGNVKGAVARINNMQEQTISIGNIVNTGLPPIDAILSAKVARAGKYDIDIEYTIIIDGELNIDQFDIAVIIANALDNAIEGIERSKDIEKTISLNINRTGEYVLIIIENYATGPIYDDFQTSKQDKKNHGFGMVQMKEVAQKYGGSFCPFYNSETGKFSLKIMLTNKK